MNKKIQKVLLFIIAIGAIFFKYGNFEKGKIVANYNNRYLDNNNCLNVTNYSLNNNIIYRVNLGTFKSSLIDSSDSSGTVTVVTSSGSTVASTTALRTGYVLKATCDSSTKTEYTIAVLGDVLGNGKVTRNGAIQAATDVLNKKSTVDASFLAADIDGDGVLKMNDVMRILQAVNTSDTTPVKLGVDPNTITPVASTINVIEEPVNSSHLARTILTADTSNLSGSNFTYKWYLDGSEIPSEWFQGQNPVASLSDDDKTLMTSKYGTSGTYKVEVYSNSKKVAEGTHKVNSAEISYEVNKDSDTKWVFVNNPENLYVTDMADYSTPKILYNTTFSKNVELYFEHNRDGSIGTTTPFYYAIRVHNPNTVPVTIKVNNAGASRCGDSAQTDLTGEKLGCRYYANTWMQYYSGRKPYQYSNGALTATDEYTIEAGKYLYFYLSPDSNINAKWVTYADNEPIESVSGFNNWAFDGVLNITNETTSASNALNIANLIFFNYSSALDKRTTLTTIRAGGNLTGEYVGKPEVTNNVSFEITNDTPKGNMLVNYNYESDESGVPRLFNSWITNMAGNYTSSLGIFQRETLPLQWTKNGISTHEKYYYQTKGATFQPFSNMAWANYAVHYKENITIKNSSSSKKKVAFVISSGSNTTSELYKSLATLVPKYLGKTYFTSNGVKVYLYPSFTTFGYTTYIKVWQAEIPTGTTITVPSEALMGGMSTGTIYKMVCIDECYDIYSSITTYSLSSMNSFYSPRADNPDLDNLLTVIGKDTKPETPVITDPGEEPGTGGDEPVTPDPGTTTDDPVTVVVNATSNNSSILASTTLKPVTSSLSGSSFTYKWYKNNTLISGATKSTYDATTDGTYKVNIYSNSKLVATGTKVVNTASISYSVNTDSNTKWIYVDAPESITEANFADKGSKAIYNTTFTKNAEIYFEHIRATGKTTPYYYAIRLYNHNSTPVTVTINNAGGGRCGLTGGTTSGETLACDYYANTWMQYYNGTKPYQYSNGTLVAKNQYEIASKGFLYLYLSPDSNVNTKWVTYSDNVPNSEVSLINSWSFNGVLNITSTGKLYIANLMFYEYSTSLNTVTDLATISTTAAGSTKFTGEYAGKPSVTNEVNFEINSDTPDGNMLVNYNNRSSNSAEPRLFNSWGTNLIGAEDADSGFYQREGVPITWPKAAVSEHPSSYFRKTITAMSPFVDDTSWTNFGVHYNENITVTNNSSTSKTVAFVISSGQAEGAAANRSIGSFVTDHFNGTKYKYLDTSIYIQPYTTFATYRYLTYIKVWQATIPAGQTISVSSTVVLGGASNYGKIYKMLCINKCYEVNNSSTTNTSYTLTTIGNYYLPVSHDDFTVGNLKTVIGSKKPITTVSGTGTGTGTTDPEPEPEPDPDPVTITINAEKVNSTVLSSVKLTPDTSSLSGSSFTYKWYKSNTVISGATSKTYTATTDGTYKAEVYSNSKLVANGNYVVSTPNISYSLNTDQNTKWVYAGAPFSITTASLADRSSKLIHKTTFKNTIEYYFESARNTGLSGNFYYAVRIYNPNSSSVTINVNNAGAGRCGDSNMTNPPAGEKLGCQYYANTWMQYYNNNKPYQYSNGSLVATNQYTIGGGKYLYFYLSPDSNINAKWVTYSDNVPIDSISSFNSWGFNGVLNITNKTTSASKELEIANMMFYTYSSDLDTKTYTLASADNTDSTKFTGEYAGKPEVTNSVSFTIDNDTPTGNMLVNYNNASTSSTTPRLFNSWGTNYNGTNSNKFYQRETIPITWSNKTMEPFNSNMTWYNLGVHYNESITVTNNSSAKKTISFVIATGHTNNSATNKSIGAFVTGCFNKSSCTKSGITIQSYTTFATMPYLTYFKVWQVTLGANKTITVPSTITVGGIGSGQIYKMLCIGKCFEVNNSDTVTTSYSLTDIGSNYTPTSYLPSSGGYTTSNTISNLTSLLNNTPDTPVTPDPGDDPGTGGDEPVTPDPVTQDSGIIKIDGISNQYFMVGITFKADISSLNVSAPSYTWKLNDKLISSTYSNYLSSGAISYNGNTLYTQRYGKISVDVVKNNNTVNSSSHTINAATIKYTKDTTSTSKWVFINNPEGLTENDMADSSYGKKIIYNTTFTKNIELYFEHNRSISYPLNMSKYYYAVRVHNPGSAAITLTVNKAGASRCGDENSSAIGEKFGCSYYTNTWQQYYNLMTPYQYSNGSLSTKTSYSIPSNGYLYFYLSPDSTKNAKWITYSDNEPVASVSKFNAWAWDGVLNLTNSGSGSLDIATLMFFEYNSSYDSLTTMTNIVTDMSNGGGNITGEYTGKPEITNTTTFKINDDTPDGNLLVNYNFEENDSALPRLFGGWQTNITGTFSAAVAMMQRDVIPIKWTKAAVSGHSKYYYQTQNATFKPFTNMAWANYAVHYNEKITVTNNSSASKKVAFVVASGQTSASKTIDKNIVTFVTGHMNGTSYTDSTSNVTIKPYTSFAKYPYSTYIKVWEATIPSGKSITVPSKVLLGGMSTGALYKMVCINKCYNVFNNTSSVESYNLSDINPYYLPSQYKPSSYTVSDIHNLYNILN